MNEKELKAAVDAGPVAIRMNDGREYMVESNQFITVGPSTAAVLCREDDGEYYHSILPLITMSGVRSLVK